jgi:hypothetical protein
MADEGYKLQVNIKTPTGDLINVRANTSDELSVLLEGITDFSHQIAATAKAVSGAYTLIPLATSISTADVMQPPLSIPDQARAVSPTCIHGARKYLSGVSKKNGQPYAMWVCPEPLGATQCKPAN